MEDIIMSAQDYFKNSVWESFTANNGITLDFVIQSAIAMVIALIMGIIIYMIYYKNFGGVVYSNTFAITLIGTTILTCGLTIAISSNIVISLGMVGALSIVRYRTAIKDPIDLLYLFWSISTGIMVAAKLYLVATMIMIVMIIIIRIFTSKRKVGNVYILLVHYRGDKAGDEVIRTIGKLKHQIKSKTIRAGLTELTIEIYSKTKSTMFAENIDAIEGVSDVSLIQYNGEYNG